MKFKIHQCLSKINYVMSKKIIVLMCFLPFVAFSQGVNITSWNINTTGHQAQYYTSTSAIVDLNDSSEVLQVCYNDD
ncbi:MAG TPA: hypothetical protein VK177_17115, partial [Flavobacteriales bacterium]|nr:hypothetical protein [Flavobacteriales bacterium]